MLISRWTDDFFDLSIVLPNDQEIGVMVRQSEEPLPGYSAK